MEFVKQLWALGQSFSQDSSSTIVTDTESNVIGDLPHTVIRAVDGVECGTTIPTGGTETKGVPVQPQEKLEKYSCIPTEHFGMGNHFLCFVSV
jgi:hypothetical protein